MSDTRIASRYAKALYETAADSNKLEAVVGDIRELNAVVTGSADFNTFLQSPLIGKEAKLQSLNKLFGKFQDQTRNLFNLMATKSREDLIGNMGLEFIKIYNRNHGITEVQVTTASELDKDSLSKIEQFVKSNTGAKSVNIHTKTDATLIGGLTIMFDGKIYDSSVSSQIKKIKKELKIA